MDNSYIPPEYAAQLAQLQRQKAMAEMLSQRAMAPQGTQVITGHAVKNAPLGNIARALTAFMGQRQAGQADEGVNGLLSQIMQSRQQAMQGAVANPNQAQTSMDPMVRQIAENLLKQRADRTQAGAKILGEAGQTEAALKTLGSENFDPNISLRAPKMPEFGTTPGANGPVPTVTNYDKYGIPNARLGGGQTINLPGTKQQAAAEAAVGGKVPEVLESARNTFISNLEAIERSNQIYSLASDPEIIAGFGANAELGLRQLGAKLGFSGGDAVAKTENLLSKFAKQTLEASKLLKGSITEKEYPFLYAAAGGNITWTPQALQSLAAEMGALNHNSLLAAKEQWEGAASQPGAGGGAAMYPLPPLEYQLPKDVKYEELSRGRLRYNANQTPASKPAALKGAEQVLTIDQLSPAQRAELLKKLQGG